MLNAARRSIRIKIVFVVLLTTLVALAVSAAALLISETRNYGAFLINDAETQAEVFADITAPALVFNDPAAAQATLAPLSRRQEIAAAAVFSAEGKLFASYAQEPSYEFPTLGTPGTRVAGTTLTVFHPIVQNDTVIGTIYLHSRYEIADRLRDYVLILLGVMLPSFVVATLLSLWLAGGVTNPLRAVTDVARHVVEHRDFTARAPKTSEDEIGVFVDGFNEMVAEVGRRAAALEESNRALKQETEERRQAEVALRRADQRKDEFLATLAHELRNPLAPMVNSLTLLESPKVTPDVTSTAQAILRRQLSQLKRLVDDLLDVSRITSGKLVVRKQGIDLAQALRSAVETARPLLEQRQQTLTVDIPPMPLLVQGDSVRLSQVFSNLLNNAAIYSAPGTRISLRAEVDGDSARVRVADQGVGIARDALSSIFEMFSQEQAADGTQYGLGVGLALARRLAELHGGTVVAESAGKGHGSVFTVTLPLDASVKATDTDAAPQSAAKSPKRRILLVDDNVDFAASMSILLQSLGHDVRLAHDGRQAVTVARDFRPEIGFLDLGLPDFSGFELATKLKGQPESSSTVLIAVSGWGQARDRERSREAGFALHLVKPVDLRSIEAALVELLPGGHHA